MSVGFDETGPLAVFCSEQCSAVLRDADNRCVN